MPRKEDFRIIAFSSGMDDIGEFRTSDPKLNRLQANIRWSQAGNTISIPTDCPQREKAGWTGDIMVYAPTMCANAEADGFLRSWMRSLRAEQLPDGAVPMIVPYLPAYREFLGRNLGSNTSCGWGDAVLAVPLALYDAYGDRQVLEENYEAMRRWLAYIAGRAENHHPEEYGTWSRERQERSRYLWNTDYHFGDRLDTGFLSVPFLMDVLCANGSEDLAYRLLFQTKCPSWLYEVEKGATTLWESWGAVAGDGTVSTYSYNHYAFGCVGDWITGTWAGFLRRSPATG